MKMRLFTFALAAALSPSMAFAQRDDEKGKQGPRRGEMQRPEMQRPGQGGRPGGFGGNAGPMAPGGPNLGMMAKFFPVMVALDADQDGNLSATEIANASKALLKLDKDGDGVLSLEELRPDPSSMPGMMAGPGGPGPGAGGPMGPLNGAMMAKLFESRDLNGDGKLEGDEIPERMRERLSMLDKDGDGALQKSEMERAAALMGDRNGPKGRGNDNDGSGVKPKRPGQ
jgi:Ca2+-binding EF-hand superfamily protein